MEQIRADRTFIQCTIRVETIIDTENQREVTLAEHQGKTNYRGVQETLQALRRKYFWCGIKKTIEDIMPYGACEICLATK